MGVLAPVTAHAGPSAQPPIDVSENFPPHMSAEWPPNICPNPSEVISEVSEVYDNFFNFCPNHYDIVLGDTDIFFIGILIIR